MKLLNLWNFCNHSTKRIPEEIYSNYEAPTPLTISDLFQWKEIQDMEIIALIISYICDK